MNAPGSLRPQRTVRASFPAHGSGTFKAVPAKEDPAVITVSIVVDNKSSNLSSLLSYLLSSFCSGREVFVIFGQEWISLSLDFYMIPDWDISYPI